MQNRSLSRALPAAAAPLLALVLGGLAAAPAMARSAVAAGRAASVEGEVQLIVEDYPDHAVTRSYLRTADGQRLELLLGADAPLPSPGARLRLSGWQSGALLAVDGSGTAVTAPTTAAASVAPAPPALTLGEQKTVVLLVNFSDDTRQPWTAAEVVSRVFGEVDGFYREASFQQVWLSGDVLGWYTLPIAATCTVSDIATAAKQAAAAAGVDLGRYAHLVYAYPANAACGMSGQGTIGGSPSELWINGDLSLHTVAHELGHNFGLYHSHALECGATVIGSSCSVAEYGDRFDTMGISGNSHFNAYQKERLGWLGYGASPPLATVQSSGTYAIEPYETAAAGAPKALKILKSTDPTTGARTWYYLEFRQALGYDSGLTALTNANYARGVLVHLGTEGNGRTSQILNMTPLSDPYFDWNDVALTVGQSYTDSAAGVTFSTAWADSSGAGVTVTFSTPAPAPLACTLAAPQLSLSGGATSVAAGSTVSYTLTLTNQDSSGCAASTFNLSASLPSGWSGSLATASLSLAPGATASTTLAVTSPTTAAAGSYSIGVSATNGSNASISASATATYSVASSSGTKKGSRKK